MSPIESIWAVFKIFKFAKWSPHVRASTTVLESGFQVLDSNLCQWNLESGFQLLVGFRTPWAAFRIPKPRIPYSASTIFPDSSFRSTSKHFRESRIRIPLHKAPIAHSSRDHSWNLFFFNAFWRSLLGSWTRHLWGNVSAKDVVANILAGYLETVGTGSQRVPCFFCSPSQLWGVTRKTTKTCSILRRRTDLIPSVTNKFSNWEQMSVQASDIWLMLVRFPGTILGWGSRYRFLEY